MKTELEAKAHARVEEAEAAGKEFIELLSGAGVRNREDLELLLERHKMSRAHEESANN